MPVSGGRARGEGNGKGSCRVEKVFLKRGRGWGEECAGMGKGERGKAVSAVG